VLTEALSRSPESVVLFDEVEKAHPRMHNLLLQILEEGALTDGKGRRVRFDKSIVILTSNAGAADFESACAPVGFHRESVLGEATQRDITRAALQRSFAPELLGRIDDVIQFRELEPRDVRRIAQKQLTELAVRARRRGARVAFTPAVAEWVARHGHSPQSGARGLRHVIQRDIEPPLAREQLDQDLPASALVRVRIQGARPSFAIEA
jgi:ATP-dependent Clp protease ATP-binding subunit ClpC